MRSKGSCLIAGVLMAGGQATAQPGAGVVLEAEMPQDLTPGRDLELLVTLSVPDDWSASADGSPSVLVQIDAPDGVGLLGRTVSGFSELSRSNFLELPWEREVRPGETVIPFSIDPERRVIGLLGLSVNAVAYLQDGDGNNWFVRRRVNLEISPGASASSADQAEVSAWGRNGTLAIGDEAQPFVLPRADGTTVDLSEYLGEKNIIVTTYRAFW